MATRECKRAISQSVNHWLLLAKENRTLILTPEVAELVKMSVRDMLAELGGSKIPQHPDIKVTKIARTRLVALVKLWAEGEMLDELTDILIRQLLKGIHKSKIPFGTDLTISCRRKSGKPMRRKSWKMSRSLKK